MGHPQHGARLRSDPRDYGGILTRNVQFILTHSIYGKLRHIYDGFSVTDVVLSPCPNFIHIHLQLHRSCEFLLYSRVCHKYDIDLVCRHQEAFRPLSWASPNFIHIHYNCMPHMNIQFIMPHL